MAPLRPKAPASLAREADCSNGLAKEGTSRHHRADALVMDPGALPRDGLRANGRNFGV